jgi:peptidoglycan/xylan/chitin deacetylase (PgdA/CDA1 family)
MLHTILGSAGKAIRSPFKRLLNLADPPVVVLVYHRIASLASDPELLAVTPENFRAQLRHLKDSCSLVRFEEDWTKVPKPAVAITFDDGYADNAVQALPILEEMEVPATVFVTTGQIGTKQEFWWHELERLLLKDGTLPATFQLDGTRFGRKWRTGSSTEREAFYRQMVRLMNDVDSDLRNKWLCQIREWSKAGAADGDLHRALTLEELRLLAGSKWVTIGAHTVTHTRLAALSPYLQKEEIAVSKRQLEAWLGQDISVFSYPFGRKCDYTKETVSFCREAGFVKTAANFPGQAHRWTDPHQIPRHLVRNWRPELFAEKLGGFWTR